MTYQDIPEASAELHMSKSAAFSSGYRYYILAVLTVVYMVNVIDRQILTILLEPIKRDMGLSDTQLGFLTGISFAVFYATMGIPLAMWADRGNRRNIISITLSIFAGMTALSGLATNFVQLLLARIFVAIGDAGTMPASHSIISDMFSSAKRAAAIGVFFVGGNLGTLAGFLLGGWISQAYGWHAAFFLVGTPGLLLVILVQLTVKEPKRGDADALTHNARDRAPLVKEVVVLLWSQRSFRHMMAAVAINSISSYAMITWLPSFLMRSHDISPSETGAILAVMVGVIGGLGTFCSGHIADWLGKRDIRWNLWIIAIVNVLSFPLCQLMYLAGPKAYFLALFVFPAFAYSFFLAPTVAMGQSLVNMRMRAQASAIYFLILSLIGGGLGPQLTGIFSDFYQSTYGPQSVRYALMTMSGFLIWSSLHYILAARTLREDVERINP